MIIKVCASYQEEEEGEEKDPAAGFLPAVEIADIQSRMPANQPSASKDRRGPAKGAPSRAQASKSSQGTPHAPMSCCQSGQVSPIYCGSTYPLYEPDQCHGCCNHPRPVAHQCYAPQPPASQATLVSTPIPISVPMPMPGGGGGPTAPIVINAPAAPPASPPPPPPPPPPEPRPSPAQEVASMMMLTMVDYMRRRMDKQLALVFGEEPRELPNKPPSPEHSAVMLPRSPLTPMQTAESSAVTSPTAGDRKDKKDLKAKKGKKGKEEAGGDDIVQRGESLPAISAKGADVVKNLEDILSEGPGDHEIEIPQEEEEESPSKNEAAGRGLCCCCLFLWLALLLAAFALAAAYLMFPNSVSDILCSLGIAKPAGLNDLDQIDHFNDTNITRLLQPPIEPEWGRSIFDVQHIADDSAPTDSPQDDLRLMDEEYEEAGKASSQGREFKSTTVETQLISAISKSTPAPLFASFFSLNHSEDSGDGDSLFDDEPSGGVIDFDSFIDVAAFGRLMRPPPWSSRRSYTQEVNGASKTTSNESSLSTTTPAAIQDLLERLGLASALNGPVIKTTHNDWLDEGHVTSGAAIAFELDDEGEEWPVAGREPRYTVRTKEYRGSVTLDGFRIPSMTHLNGLLPLGSKANPIFKR